MVSNEGNKHVDVIENVVVRDHGRVGFCGGKKTILGRKPEMFKKRKQDKSMWLDHSEQARGRVTYWRNRQDKTKKHSIDQEKQITYILSKWEYLEVFSQREAL